MIPKIKKILYATDLSKNSSYAFLYAADMAKRHGAQIVVLHAVEPIPSYAGAYAGVSVVPKQEDLDKMAADIKKHVQEACQKAAAQLGAECVALVSKILVPYGHPAEEILNAANQEECDAIVLGTHGKGFLSHTFLGSVSSDVLHRTRKPVFIIPLAVKNDRMNWLDSE
jgi:nucleotide-binding universal stress UspA family protein